MTIELACPADVARLTVYDGHIPAARLADCVQQGLVYVLRPACGPQEVVGVLRYSFFWQTIPFLDLLYIDQAYRGRGYGRQMMACWEVNLRRRAYRWAMTSTQADETAYLFYESLGYRRVGAFRPPEQEADEWMYLKEWG